MVRSDWEADLNELEGVCGPSLTTTYTGARLFKAFNKNSDALCWILFL